MNMMLIRILTLTCLFSANIATTIHWMVTENGLIQPKENSPFLMEKPYDLINFINQDTRWQNIHNMYYDLINRQKKINKMWNKLLKDCDFESHFDNNKHCESHDPNKIDWYSSFMEDGKFFGIKEDEFLLSKYESGDTDIPDCKKISSLTFSMATFEHLEGMRYKENLNLTAESTLPELFAPLLSYKQFGHWVSDMLRKNSSSWLHYNLAAIYWRLEGSAAKALECSRRAVHYAPRWYKAVPLLCMGTIFHRSMRPEEAITVLRAAVDHNRNFAISHFTLGAAYAVYGEYNTSLKFLNRALELHKTFKSAIRFKDGILCFLDMYQKMEDVRSLLRSFAKELDDFKNKQALWLKIQAAFLSNMQNDGKFDVNNIDANINEMSKITGLNIMEIRKHAIRNYHVQFFMESATYTDAWERDKTFQSLIHAYTMKRALKIVGANYNFPAKILKVDEKLLVNRSHVLEEIGPGSQFPIEMFIPERGPPVLNPALRNQPSETSFNINFKNPVPLENDPKNHKYPKDMSVSRVKESFDKTEGWPPHTFCRDHAHEFPNNLELIYPVYLPIENKGIVVSGMLSVGIGSPALSELPLPWHPPHCAPHTPHTTHTTNKALKVQVVPSAISRQYLREHLLSYIADNHMELVQRMQDAEIGQRITTAMERKTSPMWALASVASVYWRVRGSSTAARACAHAALRLAPAGARDAALVSLASLQLERGHVDDAHALAEQAYEINSFEPATNFLLAQICMIKKNHQAQMFHLKQVVRVEPNFMKGYARNLLNAWACILKQANTLAELGESHEPELCAEVDSEVSMVCKRDGTDCHVSKGNCQLASRKHAVSTLIRLIDLQKEEADMDATIFDKFIKDMPPKRTDIAHHQRNFELLKNTMYMLIKGCGKQGCGGLPKHLSFSLEDCDKQYMNLNYWLATVNFKEELQFDKNLVSDVLSSPVVSMRAPSCAVGGDARGEWAVRAVLQAPPHRWRAQVNAMHTLNDIFSYFDFHMLGAKIATYVEAHPTWWVGLAGAAWWCGAAGHAECAVQCAAAAHHHAPQQHAHRALRPLAVTLHMQGKHEEATELAYVGFYLAPKSKIEAFIVGISHTYKSEYEQAAWMYRYALTFDPEYIPVKASLHIAMCLLSYGDTAKKNLNAVAA